MKAKQLIIGTIIALVLIMGIVMVVKSGQTSNSETAAPPSNLSK